MKKNYSNLKNSIIFLLSFFSLSLLGQTNTSPTQTVCIGSSEPYLLNPSNSSSTYQWTISGGGVISSGQGTGSIQVDWGNISGGPYILSVVETDMNGCVGPTKTVDVTISEFDDATFNVSDFCEGASNFASAIATSGGVFSFNPIPSSGEIIDPLTGEITGGIAGNTYHIEYITSGQCFSQNIETLYVNPLDNPFFVVSDFCEGAPNSASAIATGGGVFSFNPIPSSGEIIDPLTGEITGGIAGTSYTVQYVTNGICPSQSLESLNVNLLDDPSFVVNDFCEGAPNSASSILTSGGVFSFNPTPTSGEIIDPSTGEITGGIAGLTYSIEYTTSGICSSSSLESLIVNSQDDASFIVNNFCESSPNSASSIVTIGGVFSFNPIPTSGEIIDPLTGEISGGLPGISYTIQYSTLGVCPDTQFQNVLIYSTPVTGPIFHN